MNPDHLRTTLLLVIAMAGAGFALGLAYFALVRRTARLIAMRQGWLAPTALTLGRMGGAIAVLALAAQLGAAALLATFAGLLLARQVALREPRGAR